MRPPNSSSALRAYERRLPPDARARAMPARPTSTAPPTATASAFRSRLCVCVVRTLAWSWRARGESGTIRRRASLQCRALRRSPLRYASCASPKAHWQPRKGGGWAMEVSGHDLACDIPKRQLLLPSTYQLERKHGESPRRGVRSHLCQRALRKKGHTGYSHEALARNKNHYGHSWGIRVYMVP